MINKKLYYNINESWLGWLPNGSKGAILENPTLRAIYSFRYGSRRDAENPIYSN